MAAKCRTRMEAVVLHDLSSGGFHLADVSSTFAQTSRTDIIEAPISDLDGAASSQPMKHGGVCDLVLRCSISPQALARAENNRQFRSLQLASDVKFGLSRRDGAEDDGPGWTESPAHVAGVSSIAIDRFEGRYLVSAGADSSIAVWDLEAVSEGSDAGKCSHEPLAVSARTSLDASLGITHISFYPFDSLALLTCGYDHTLKLFSSETLTASATFNIGSIVYSHATSTVASHLLVACASQHPSVRLVDLRSGANTHSLAGHSGSVLTVAWHPKDENILASGASDGVIRVWDVRRSASSLGVLNMEDSIGVAGYDGTGIGARRRERGRSHNGAVNGIVWTEDARSLVSTGHDERMRVWNMTTGANTLANFGPGLKNATTTALLPLIVPSHVSELGKETVVYPNPREILSFDVHSGELQSRLRVLGFPGSQGIDRDGRNLKNRTTSLAWRTHHIQMYSAHGDGSIRCWRPRTWEEALADREHADDDIADVDDVGKKRKREEFDQIISDLTKKKITFS